MLHKITKPCRRPILPFNKLPGFLTRTKVKLEIGIVPKWDQDHRKFDRITISKIPFQKTSVQTIQNQDPWPPEFLSSSDHLDNIGY